MKAPQPDKVFLLYGEWSDPQTQLNFVICRIPGGRVPWSRKMAPALRRLVVHQFNGKGKHWWVDGLMAAEMERVWNGRGNGKARRFNWDGTGFVEAP